MALEIATAEDLIALDMEGRQAARRAARETKLLRRVLRAFVDQAGPVPVEEIVAASRGCLRDVTPGGQASPGGGSRGSVGPT